MAETDTTDQRDAGAARSVAADHDEGLRRYMIGVYNHMLTGVAITGAVSAAVLSNAAVLDFAANLSLLWFIAVLGISFLAPRIIASGSVGAAHACFWTYAVLWGLLLAPVLMHYASLDPWAVPRAFLITAGAFAGMSLLGYTTRRDLGPLGTFCAVALIGLLVAMVVGLFIPAGTTFSLLFSGAVVLVMAGMTAYETQAVKNRYDACDDAGTAARKSVFGAFELYSSAVVMFVHILNILGIMNE